MKKNICGYNNMKKANNLMISMSVNEIEYQTKLNE